MASSRREAARATSKTAVFLVSIVVIAFGDWILEECCVIAFGDWILEECLMSSATACRRL